MESGKADPAVVAPDDNATGRPRASTSSSQPLSDPPALQGAQPSPSDAPIRALIRNRIERHRAEAARHRELAKGWEEACSRRFSREDNEKACSLRYEATQHDEEADFLEKLEALLPARQGAE